MKNIYLKVTLLLCIIISFNCKQTNEPIEKKDVVSGITETGSQGPDDFIGNIDLDDWDSEFYKQFTIEDNYWINRSLNDTIAIIGDNFTNNIEILNRSNSDLHITITSTPPFKCSIDTLNLAVHQKEKLHFTIDSSKIGQDTLILGYLTVQISNNPPLQYVLRWKKPTNTGIEVVVPRRNKLYPAYPNPADGYITLFFTIKSEQHVLLKILDSKLNTVSILMDKDLKAGSYSYCWLTTEQEKNNFPEGIYRVVLETDGYSCSGDILIQK